MIRTFRNKQLQALWETGRSRIDAQMHSSRLDALDAATQPEDMNLPGFNFHALKGLNPTRYTVHVNGPWCITFEFREGDAYVLDYEQYHQEVRMTVRNPDRCPTHPGELLREDVLPAVKRHKTEIAEGLGISRQHLHDIFAERKPVTTEMAVRLAKMFGGSTESWLRMQTAYDAWHAAREVDVSRIPRLVAAE